MVDPEWILGTCSAVLGWAALRQVGRLDKLDDTVNAIDKRVVHVEAKLMNGLSDQLSEISKQLDRMGPRRR